MSATRLRGFTLVECIIYCALLALFSGAMLVSLAGSATSSTRELTEASTQAALAVSRLTLELDNSTKASVSTGSKPDRIVFAAASAEPSDAFKHDTTGAVWNAWTAYLLEGDELVRYHLPLKQPIADLTVTPSVTAVKGGQREVVARGVTRFAPTSPQVGLWAVELEVGEGDTLHTYRSAGAPRN